MNQGSEVRVEWKQTDGEHKMHCKVICVYVRRGGAVGVSTNTR